MNDLNKSKEKNLLRYIFLVFQFVSYSSYGSCPNTISKDTAFGINFNTGPWLQVVNEAKRQKKIIFLDVYTTWCAPCKLMAKQAFSNSEVGKIFNEKFISYQIDAEKGEGISLAKKYGVDAYPTSLYISPDGDLVHRVSGYSGIKHMLLEADKAALKFKKPNRLADLSSQYKEGNRNSEFLANYLSELSINKNSNGEVLDIYLGLIPVEQWSLLSNLELIINNTTDIKSNAYSFLMKQVPLLLKSENRQTRELGIAARMQQFQVINKTLDKAIKTKDEQLLDECIACELNVYSTMSTSRVNPESFSTGQRMYFYQQTRQMLKYIPLATVEADRLMGISIDSVKALDAAALKRFFIEKFVTGDSVKIHKTYKLQIERLKGVESNKIAKKLNDLASTLCENVTNDVNLGMALTWSVRTLEYSRNSKYLETTASLLTKLNRAKEAITLIKEAIAQEKDNGKDTIRLKNILDKLLN